MAGMSLCDSRSNQATFLVIATVAYNVFGEMNSLISDDSAKTEARWDPSRRRENRGKRGRDESSRLALL